MNINTNETTHAGLPAIAVVMTSPRGGGKGMDIYTMTTYLPIVQTIIDSFKIL
jgi:hypothetical protein